MIRGYSHESGINTSNERFVYGCTATLVNVIANERLTQPGSSSSKPVRGHYVASDSTNKLLDSYHDASKRIEGIRVSQIEDKERYFDKIASAREILSRCILCDDPVTFIFLMGEIAIVLGIVGQPEMAHRLEQDTLRLLIYFSEHGTF